MTLMISSAAGMVYFLPYTGIQFIRVTLWYLISVPAFGLGNPGTNEHVPWDMMH